MLVGYTDQAGEISTIKERTFVLKLSDADVERLYERAHSDDITPEELLEGFIGDLLEGTYSHGSDERQLANDYYERCDYAPYTPSLLAWSLREAVYEELYRYMEEWQYANEELEYLKAHPEETDSAEMEGLESIKSSVRKNITKLYGEYVQAGGKQALEEGTKEVIAYMDNLHSMVFKGRRNGREVN